MDPVDLEIRIMAGLQLTSRADKRFEKPRGEYRLDLTWEQQVWFSGYACRINVVWHPAKDILTLASRPKAGQTYIEGGMSCFVHKDRFKVISNPDRLHAAVMARALYAWGQDPVFTVIAPDAIDKAAAQSSLFHLSMHEKIEACQQYIEQFKSLEGLERV